MYPRFWRLDCCGEKPIRGEVVVSDRGGITAVRSTGDSIFEADRLHCDAEASVRRLNENV